MNLAKSVACTALILMIVLFAGHGLAAQSGKAQAERQKAEDKAPPRPVRCTIKPVMTDAEIDACRAVYRGR